MHHLARLIRSVIGSRRARGGRRVAVICDSFIRYGTSQAIGLQAAGADVVFYFIDRLGEFDGNAEDRDRYIQNVRDAGIPVVTLPQRSMARLPQHVRELHRDLAEREVGLVFLQAHIDPRYVSLPLRFNVATIIHDPKPHTGDFESTYPLPVRAVARLAEAASSALFVHSDRLVPTMFPMLRGIPTGVFPHGTDMAPASTPVPPTPRVILIGRLMPYKGVDTALDAFKIVHEARPDAELVLAGRGRMGDDIRARQPAGVELRDGYIPDDELEELMLSARISLLPYRDATQSGVGLICVAKGIPCIVTDTGGLPDLVPPSRPEWVVPVGDAPALARAILGLLDQDQADRDAVFDYADKYFAWPAVGRRMLDESERLAIVGSVRATKLTDLT